MQISLIFFTIIIERREKTPEERYEQYLHSQELERLKHEQLMLKAQFPEYLTRV